MPNYRFADDAFEDETGGREVIERVEALDMALNTVADAITNAPAVRTPEGMALKARALARVFPQACKRRQLAERHQLWGFRAPLKRD
jgi:hypothetical protein